VATGLMGLLDFDTLDAFCPEFFSQRLSLPGVIVDTFSVVLFGSPDRNKA
jgi:hypothetical protein